jgi:hypothetical protein
MIGLVRVIVIVSSCNPDIIVSFFKKDLNTTIDSSTLDNKEQENPIDKVVKTTGAKNIWLEETYKRKGSIP